MPRRQPLNSIIPNRFYEIDATLKYQHIGENMITGIIRQITFQTKICIPKDGISLEVGKQYIFGKCFNSKNGWLYAKQPSQTVVQKDEASPGINRLTLKEIYEQKDNLSNHYISTQLKVISIEPKQTVFKNDENLILYKMECFSDQMTINMEIWNREINTEEVKNKILDFIGFRIKQTSHQTIILISTVYSKIQELQELPYRPQRFNFQENTLYKNVSSFYEVRTIEEIEIACESFHKNYSACLGFINFSEELSYEGCAKCKKKVQQNGCFQCGSNVSKATYNYLKVVLEDDTSMLECAIFDEEALKIAKQLGTTKAVFKVKLATKRNLDTGEPFLSHVITCIKELPKKN